MYSHDGNVFQRGPDQIPRGNMTLYFKVLYHDARQALYERHWNIIKSGKDSDVLELARMIADRIEGTPSKKVAAPTQHVSNFILTTRDGQETELFTSKAAAPAPTGPKPMPADDVIIMGGRVGELRRV